MPATPPTPIWKMRSLLFLLTCARAGSESDAIPAVTITPVLRKLRRVTGEKEGGCCFMFIMARSIVHGKPGDSREHRRSSTDVKAGYPSFQHGSHTLVRHHQFVQGGFVAFEAVVVLAPFEPHADGLALGLLNERPIRHAARSP